MAYRHRVSSHSIKSGNNSLISDPYRDDHVITRPGGEGIAALTGYDGLVASSGGDYTSIQDADDALVSDYHLWIKSATYDEDITISSNNNYLKFSPGTTIDDGASSGGTITVSGNNNVIEFHPCCTVDGDITLSGENNTLILGTGCTIGNIIVASGGDNCVIDGRGLGTTAENIDITGDALEIRQINLNSKTPAAGDHAITFNNISGSDKHKIDAIRIRDSDSSGIACNNTTVDSFICNITVVDSDLRPIQLGGARMIVNGNHIFGNTTLECILAGTISDDSIIAGNFITNASSGQSVEILSGGDDCVVVSNRAPDGILDNSTGSTVADNDTT